MTTPPNPPSGPNEYPVATPEVAKLLGMASSDPTVHPVQPHAPAPEFLPVHEEHAEAEPAPSHDHAEDHGHVTPTHDSHADHGHGGHGGITHTAEPAVGSSILPKLRVFGMFVAVFVVALLLYFFFFSNVDFGSLFKSKPTAVSVKDSALQSLQKTALADYTAWIGQYYYDVSDPAVIDPNADNSGNGLSNFQKFLLNLNPKQYDTLGLGRADSESLAAGINPNSGAPLTDAQKKTIDTYFDMEVIMNKLSLAKLHTQQQVAGAQTVNPSTTTNPSAVGTGSPSNTYVAPTTGANLSDPQNDILTGNNIDINTAIPARLEVPSLQINVPIIWSADPKDFETDLKSGVIHYPGTALPGQIGTMYISGHSSNYAWVKGNYNHVFTHLGDLANNTSFKITVVQKNGKDAIFHYVVTRRQEYLPTDIAQFQNGGKSEVALSTCWPVGSTAKRLVVFGTLTQVEQ